MDLDAHATIDAPIDFVFQQVTDFEAFSDVLSRRGVDVEQINGRGVVAVATRWQVTFLMQGKTRTAQVEITQLDPPNAMTVTVSSDNIDGTVVVNLSAVSDIQTQLAVQIVAKTKTFKAKLALNAMLLAKGKPTAKLNGMVETFAADISARYRA